MAKRRFSVQRRENAERWPAKARHHLRGMEDFARMAKCIMEDGTTFLALKGRLRIRTKSHGSIIVRTWKKAGMCGIEFKRWGTGSTMKFLKLG